MLMYKYKYNCMEMKIIEGMYKNSYNCMYSCRIPYLVILIFFEYEFNILIKKESYYEQIYYLILMYIDHRTCLLSTQL